MEWMASFFYVQFNYFSFHMRLRMYSYDMEELILQQKRSFTRLFWYDIILHSEVKSLKAKYIE